MAITDASKDTGTVVCEVCLKEIPRSVAQSLEGAEYVYHFCGSECYAQWQAGPAMRGIGLTVSGLALDFETAQALARIAAGSAAPEPMPLAWFDRARGRESPQVPECQRKPGWLAYAESHGGDIRVDINDGEYVFIFASGSRAGD